MRANSVQGVTSGSFTREAADWASGKPIILTDGESIARLLSAHRSAPGSDASPPSQAGIPAVADSPGPAPKCPRCGAEMVIRMARRGASAGRQFWGCRKYPDCKGTRELAS